MPVSDNFDHAEIESTLRELEQLLVDPNNAVRVLYTQDASTLSAAARAPSFRPYPFEMDAGTAALHGGPSRSSRGCTGVKRYP